MVRIWTRRKQPPLWKEDDTMRGKTIIRNVIIFAVAAIGGLIIWAAIKAFKRK